jgi:hypothetical protein
VSAPIEIFAEPGWQMSLGERAAVEGLLSQLRPGLAIEIGSAEGAGLRRIAAHAAEVHSFDLNPPALDQPGNVRLHTGDSHRLLAGALADFAEAGRNVDFVMVDGDHTPDGVRHDLEDLLDSPALGRSAILIHDTANERVRSGVEATRLSAWPKVAHVELDWVPGRLFAEPALRGELWYGLGLVLVDAAAPTRPGRAVYEQRYQPWGPLLAELRLLEGERERGELPGGELDPVGTLLRRNRELSAELAAVRARKLELEVELTRVSEALDVCEERRARVDRALRDVIASPSWKLTKPLRGAKRVASRWGGAR